MEQIMIQHTLSIGYKAVKEKAENIIRKKFAKVPKAKKVNI